MPEKLMRCVKEVKAQLRKDEPDLSDEEIERRAYATCVKSTGQHPSDEESSSVSDKIVLQWSSSISMFESVGPAVEKFIQMTSGATYGLSEINSVMQGNQLHEELAASVGGIPKSDDHFYVVGEAIHALTTANLHTYEARELSSAAQTLVNVPVMIDHSKSARDVVGRVLASGWEERAGIDSTITYIARIQKEKQDPVIHSIKVGDLDRVSVGATAEMIECSVCGENMKKCSHHIGQTYEVDGEVKLATAIGRNLEFREISVTAFPADPHASVYVANDSLFSAMEMLVESCEDKPKLRKAGEMKKMSEDRSEELEITEKLRELEENREQLKSTNQELLARLQAFEDEKKTRLVEQVLELERLANIQESEDEQVRMKELKAMSVEILEARFDILKGVTKNLDRHEPGGRAVVVDPVEERKPSTGVLQYPWEDVKKTMRQVWGIPDPSPTAVEEVRRMCLDPLHPHARDYKRRVSKNLAQIPGRSD